MLVLQLCMWSCV